MKTVIDAAERLRLYLRQANESLEMQNDAAEIAILAKHRAGEMVKEGAENGDRATKGRPRKMSNDPTFIQPVKLKEISISRDQSACLQSVAGIPKKQLESIIQDYKQERKELSSAKTFRLRQHNALPSYIINSYFVCGHHPHVLPPISRNRESDADFRVSEW